MVKLLPHVLSFKSAHFSEHEDFILLYKTLAKCVALYK